MILFLQLATSDHPGNFEHATADAVDKRATLWRPFGGPQYFGGGGWSHPQLRADLERNLHDAYATAGIAPDLGGSV